ncbi:MAG: hypothetical protein ABIK07_07740, partial [Planctomycetota bacterium]
DQQPFRTKLLKLDHQPFAYTKALLRQICLSKAFLRSEENNFIGVDILKVKLTRKSFCDIG